MINESIAKLVKYGENAGLVSGLDKIYATNRILEVMQIVMVELDARQIWNSAVRIFQKIAHGYFHA